MTTVNVTRTLPLSVDKVWPTLASFQEIHLYHPLVERVTSKNHQSHGLGAHRTCHFYDGTSVDEVITSWNEGQGFEVGLSEFSLPLKRARARISLIELADGTSQVAFAMDFTVKWGAAGWVMGELMMKPMMKRLLGKVLKGLALHLETGEPIGKDGRPEPRALLSAVG